MPRSSQRRPKHAQEMQPTSQKLDAIDSWLQKLLDAFPAKGQLTTEEITDWHKDLTPFSVDAIDYAFETHRRNAIFFPIYGQILDLCISFNPPNLPVGNPRCGTECKSRHGKGYHFNDFFWMLTKLRAPCVVGPLANPRKKKATEEEIQDLLRECDEKRPTGAPEFRS